MFLFVPLESLLYRRMWGGRRRGGCTTFFRGTLFAVTAMRYDAMRCNAMRCDVMWCDVMWCDAMRMWVAVILFQFLYTTVLFHSAINPAWHDLTATLPIHTVRTNDTEKEIPYRSSYEIHTVVYCTDFLLNVIRTCRQKQDPVQYVVRGSVWVGSSRGMEYN